MVCSFVFIIAVARFLGVEGFGKYALVLHYFELFLGFIATGLGILITREIAKSPGLTVQYLSSAIILASILTVASTATLGLIAATSAYAPDTRLAILISGAALLPAAINVLLEATFVAFETAEYISYGMLLENLLRIGSGFALLSLGFGLLSLFVVLIFSRLVTLIFYLYLLPKQDKTTSWLPGRVFFLKMCRQWRVFAAENWLSSLGSGLGVIVLSIVHGEAAVGLFVAAGRVTRLGKLVAECYTTAIFPRLTRLYAESKQAFRRLRQQSLITMVSIAIPVVIVISLIADHVILWLYTDEYVEAIPILRVLIWVLLFQCINPFLSHVLFARNRQRESFYVASIRISIYAVLCLLLIPRWGGLGAAWCSLISGMIAAAFYYFFVTRDDDSTLAWSIQTANGTVK